MSYRIPIPVASQSIGGVSCRVLLQIPRNYASDSRMGGYVTVHITPPPFQDSLPTLAPPPCIHVHMEPGAMISHNDRVHVGVTTRKKNFVTKESVFVTTIKYKPDHGARKYPPPPCQTILWEGYMNKLITQQFPRSTRILKRYFHLLNNGFLAYANEKDQNMRAHYDLRGGTRLEKNAQEKTITIATRSGNRLVFSVDDKFSLNSLISSLQTLNHETPMTGEIQLAAVAESALCLVPLQPNASLSVTGTFWVASSANVTSTLGSFRLSSAVLVSDTNILFTKYTVKENTGILVLNGGGAVLQKNVLPGSSFIVDNDNLMAWTGDNPTLELAVATTNKSLMAVPGKRAAKSALSGEGLVCRFQNKSDHDVTVYFQTRSDNTFKRTREIRKLRQEVREAKRNMAMSSL